MPDTDDDFRAAMYGRAEDENEQNDAEEVSDFVNDRTSELAQRLHDHATRAKQQELEVAVGRQTITILVDGKPTLIPTMAYVQAVEKKNEEQARVIRRLESQVKQLRMTVNSHSNEFSDVFRELDRKVNLREM